MSIDNGPEKTFTVYFVTRHRNQGLPFVPLTDRQIIVYFGIIILSYEMFTFKF